MLHCVIFKPTPYPDAISPGEPFHRTRAGSDWVVNRWAIRERGRVIWGPPPTSLIDAISTPEPGEGPVAFHWLLARRDP